MTLHYRRTIVKDFLRSAKEHRADGYGPDVGIKTDDQPSAIQNFHNSKMNRDKIIDLTMANILDIIPLISNIDNEVNADINATLVLIYERNMAMLNLVL